MTMNEINDFNPDEILENLRYCANKLLLAYDETLETELWHAFGNAADACQHLLFLMDEGRDKYQSMH